VIIIKFVDAFAGIGGFRMAMEEFGHECVMTIEYDKKAQKAYRAIWGESENEWFDDIRKLNPEDMPDFDILCGGFPCAHFSIAGDRAGFDSDDPRAKMFFELARIAEAKKPSYLLFENVKGLLNHDNGRSFAIILHTLDKLGYDVEWQLTDPRDFGYPVIRERVFIVGHLRGRNTKKVFPITTGCRYNDSETHVFQFRRGYFRVFKGYHPTLTASMGTGGNNVAYIIQNGKLRKFTPREMFRLQGIPEKYIDRLLNSGLSDSALYERAGRTVFVPIVKEIVKRMGYIE
jgi:site-specific DNA-cytosine methylase